MDFISDSSNELLSLIFSRKKKKKIDCCSATILICNLCY